MQYTTNVSTSLLILDIFLVQLNQASGQSLIDVFSGISPRMNFLSYKPIFLKALKCNLISSKSHKTQMFLMCSRNQNVLSTLYFIGFFLFMKNKTFGNVYTKKS